MLNNAKYKSLKSLKGIFMGEVSVLGCKCTFSGCNIKKINTIFILMFNPQSVLSVLVSVLCFCYLGSHQPVLPRSGYMRSPSWTRCSKVELPRERKHHSDSDTADPLMKLERQKHP